MTLYQRILKFDRNQPRNDAGRWIEMGLEGAGEVNINEGHDKALGKALDKIMKVFGADWLSALARLDKDGALPYVLSGELDLEKLAKTPAFATILKSECLMKQEDPIKKKRKYKFVVQVPAEKQTGWQEVVMDIDRIDRGLNMTRQNGSKL